MRILVSGFKPFGPHTNNPTEALIKALPNEIGDKTVDTVLLPVEYETAFQVLNQAVLKERYDSVMMLGLAAGRKNITIEHHAINLRHASLADEAGVFKQFEKIRDQGPVLVESSLPYERLLRLAKEEERPITLSTDAGAYVCNDVFYLMRLYHPHLRAGFIHVPDTSVLALNEQHKQLVWLIERLD